MFPWHVSKPGASKKEAPPIDSAAGDAAPEGVSSSHTLAAAGPPTPAVDSRPQPRWHVRWQLLALLSMAAGIAAFPFIRREILRRAALAPEHVSLMPAKNLTRTVVAPTLDSPLPAGRSAVWCASFELAWQQIKQLTNGPVKLDVAVDVADRLNRAPASSYGLNASDYFAVVGRTDEEIIETIQRTLRERFTDAKNVEVSAPEAPEAYVAYAFLAASVSWSHEYKDNPSPLEFVDSAGKRTKVRSFGILDEDLGQDREGVGFRGQAKILWRSGSQFAIDLCRHSEPYQAVLVKMPRRASFEQALREINEHAKTSSTRNENFHYDDFLLVPNMAWRFETHFSQLEDRVILNGPERGMTISKAIQSVQFRLDRQGAQVQSSSQIDVPWNGGPRYFYFDGPFYCYLQSRTESTPFLMMWVDNDELLVPF